MIRQTVITYYWFGVCIRYLQDATTRHKIGRLEDGSWVLANLGSALTHLRALDLQVTRQTAAAAGLHSLQRELTQATTEDADAKLTTEQATRLRDLISDLRKTLAAELGLRHVFIVTPKRLDVTSLLENVGSLLSPDAYGRLPDAARYDLVESGKCIAFERPTASAFHLLRGTEAILRTLYPHLARRKRIKKPWMWGAMVADLRKRPGVMKRGGMSVLLAHLDHIRQSFRNPTQHPDATYDMDQAQNLWGVCVDAIDRMAKLLPDPSAPWDDE